MDLAPRPLRPLLEWGYRRAVARDGSYKLPEVVARHLFCNDFDRAETRDLLDRLCAEPPAVILERADFSAPEGIARKYIRPRRDHALSSGTQNRLIRLLGDVDVIDIDTGHDVMMSRPVEIAEIVNAVAGGLVAQLRRSGRQRSRRNTRSPAGTELIDHGDGLAAGTVRGEARVLWL